MIARTPASRLRFGVKKKEKEEKAMDKFDLAEKIIGYQDRLYDERGHFVARHVCGVTSKAGSLHVQHDARKLGWQHGQVVWFGRFGRRARAVAVSGYMSEYAVQKFLSAYGSAFAHFFSASVCSVEK